MELASLASLARSLTGTTAEKPSQPDFVGPHDSMSVHGALVEFGKFLNFCASVNVCCGQS